MSTLHTAPIFEQTPSEKIHADRHVKAREMISYNGAGYVPAGTFGTIIETVERPDAALRHDILWENGVRGWCGDHQVWECIE